MLAFPHFIAKLKTEPEIAFQCSKPAPNDTLNFDYETSPWATETSFTTRAVKKSYYDPKFPLPLQESLAVDIPFKKQHHLASIPSRVTVGSIGYDLTLVINTETPANEMIIIPTGISVAIPKGMYGRIAE